MQGMGNSFRYLFDKNYQHRTWFDRVTEKIKWCSFCPTGYVNLFDGPRTVRQNQRLRLRRDYDSTFARLPRVEWSRTEVGGSRAAVESQTRRSCNQWTARVAESRTCVRQVSSSNLGRSYRASTPSQASTNVAIAW